MICIGSGAVAAPVLGWLSQELGWRTALLIAAAVLAVVMLPASRGFIRTPEEVGLLPDGEPPAPAGAPRPAMAAGAEFTVKQAMRTRAFWHLTLATTLRLAVINVVNIHFVPIMVWKGMAEPQAAVALLPDFVPAGSAVLVVGGEGIEEALVGAGYRPVRHLDEGPADAAPVLLLHGEPS